MGRSLRPCSRSNAPGSPPSDIREDPVVRDSGRRRSAYTVRCLPQDQPHPSRSEGGAFDTRRWGFRHKQVGLLTQEPSPKFQRSLSRQRRSKPTDAPNILQYKSTHGLVCVFFNGRRKVAAILVQSTVHIRLYPRRPTPHPQFLQVLTISPRICRACRPTPCPHSACKRDAKHRAFAKARRSWGLSADFAARRQNRATSAPWARRLRSSPGAAVLGWAHGVGRLRRRPHTRGAGPPRWGALLAVCRQMRGGKAQSINTRSTTQPGRVAALPGTRRKASADDSTALSTPARRPRRGYTESFGSGAHS